MSVVVQMNRWIKCDKLHGADPVLVWCQLGLFYLHLVCHFKANKEHFHNISKFTLYRKTDKENDIKSQCYKHKSHDLCITKAELWVRVFVPPCLFVIWTKGSAFCIIVCMRYECESECYRLQVRATTLLNPSSHHVSSTTSHFSRPSGKWDV